MVEVVAAQLVMLDVEPEGVVAASWVLAASKVTLEQQCQVLVAGKLDFLLHKEPAYVVWPACRQQFHWL